MAKGSAIFVCTNCDYRPPKWVGCCPGCSEWGSIVERQPVIEKRGALRTVQSAPLQYLHDVPTTGIQRMCSGIEEWDRVLGGGVVPGSLTILTGDPGIGKSTLLLQVAAHLAHKHKVIYFSTEESLQQVCLRAERLATDPSGLLFCDHAQLETILSTITEHKPELVIVDSIQNCYLSDMHTVPGSIGQLRETSFKFMQLAKEHTVAVLLTGHITKEGTIAGPKMLEHMVDGVFYLQGEDRWQTRMLRSVKNRFGPIHELGFFQMESSGMTQVPNINEQLLAQASFSPGSCLVSSMEGSRPLLVELQGLVVPSKFGMPQRVVTGLDPKQVQLIAAILEKYLQIKFSAHDIFFKVSGCLKIKESGADLGIALALLSSFFQKPLSPHSIALGELSLTGQVKPINAISMHVNEANKFGIRKLFVAQQQKMEKAPDGLVPLKHVYELLTLFEE